MSASSPAVVDALIEVFTWVGLGGALALGVVAVIAWAADGSWLPADAVVDRDEGRTYVRWFDADGDANSAVASPADAATLEGRETALIWYRHGWTGRMRLHRRSAGLRMLVLSAGGMLALGALCLIAGWVLYFARG
ncbi:hypothetical protein [Microbacterium dextranolyticum]|uniref:Uncharacterized protein n=1 Tax=Microbacterium dextranolyticum TaxID=36806 RepID=A0A9W6HKP2_9MICO|nr:hypothetical protein [Microbacterium dextranolyticum]MBM7462352.1 hypothetical protein [Microbacterium dextranolyticum]GLJ94602.1 hypothetical protein GCM10017591_06630 [Microbacterium dextranolyticum]